MAFPCHLVAMAPSGLCCMREEAEGMKSETQAEGAGHGGKRTRLMIDISPELRRRIRIAAAQRDLTLKEYVERILEDIVPDAKATVQAESVQIGRASCRESG